MKRKNVFNDYEIKENGDVYSSKYKERRKLKPGLDTHGYRHVAICNDGNPKSMSIHQLVALQYLPPRPSPKHEIRHLDGNILNNHYSNLEWGTHAENMADMIRHGTISRGERCGTSKLTEDQVRRIKFLKGKVEHGYWVHLSRALGVHRCTIYQILHGRRWRWIE